MRGTIVHLHGAVALAFWRQSVYRLGPIQVGEWHKLQDHMYALQYVSSCPECQFPAVTSATSGRIPHEEQSVSFTVQA